MLVHGSTVDIAGLGVLILGASGAGKSDLALRLVAEGALLVADDQTDVTSSDGLLYARSPQSIAGLLEVRGVGIVRAPVKSGTRLRLAVVLGGSRPDRMPESQGWFLPGERDGPRIPLIVASAFECSAPSKVRCALGSVPIA